MTRSYTINLSDDEAEELISSLSTAVSILDYVTAVHLATLAECIAGQLSVAKVLETIDGTKGTP